MATDLAAILEQEIQALRGAADSISDPKRRENAQQCYEIVDQPVYAPRSYPEIFHALGRIIQEAGPRAATLRSKGESAWANLIIFRAALVLEQLLKNAYKALQEFYEYMAVQDRQKIDEYIKICETRADWFSRVQAHRKPLDLIVNTGVIIEGDPFEEAVELLRRFESGLKQYRKEGTFENVSVGSDDLVVAQALQRILRDITAGKTQKRREELAAKCAQLKLLFPDAAAQIDKMFRKESESLDEL